MHPNYSQITILFVVDLYSPLAYFRMTHPFPVADTLPIKTLLAKQLPTKYYEYPTKVLLLGNSQQPLGRNVLILMWLRSIILMLKCNSKYMLSVDIGVWGLKDPPIFSDSTLYLLKTIVDLYQNLMLAFISIKRPNL